MKRLLPTLLILISALAHADPHVVGYERFHSKAPSAVGGAILFSELGCANCHGGSKVVIPRKGPSLNDLSSRVNRDWVIKFLKNPSAGRKGSTMPHMAHGVDPSEVDAMVAYLGTLGKGISLKKARHANAERGSAIFHERGCVACHAPTKDFRGPQGDGVTLESYLAIALPDLKKKTNISALSHFLSNPSRYRTDGRMPHLQLDNQQAVDVAAHLLDFQSSDARQDPGLKRWPKASMEVVAKGKSLVTSMNCASCHELPGVSASKIRPASLQAKPNKGSCISAKPVKGLPHYQLSDNQRASLMAFLKGDKAKNKNLPKGHLTFAAMNCYACHSRDGLGGPSDKTDPFFIGNISLGDSGRVPPPLTGIGHKLQHDWLVGLLKGEKNKHVRPYLKTRMPAYSAQADVLAKWLGGLDAVPNVKSMTVRNDDVEAGRKLLGAHGGVNCTTCHHWGKQKSLGIPALDISSLDKRLKPSWFRSYMLDPAIYRPGTLMPALWPKGKSSVPDVLDGDTERQIAAIWGFIKMGKGNPEGLSSDGGGRFELVPKDRPIIQRTFFEKTGTKAILVGFPGKIHIAYDGQKSQPSLVWRGKFFDAYSTWFSRFAPFEKPLSKEVYPFDNKGQKPARFRGYKLDAVGNPTFVSTLGSQTINDSYRVEDGKLIRVLKWDSGATPKASHPKGVAVQKKGGERTQKFIYSWN